ncbi:MAG: branched-chain amino acid ABC transporter substrate-binding protein [Gemmataceae bacterium]|nr:branched-chain amino acid ABC transporter substrate-binding protein [Gemmataceae bacterium]
MLRLASVTVLGIAALALTGCPNNKGGGDSKVIKIVSSLPRTGSAKGQTDTMVNGIKLAMDEVNGKIGEFTVEYLDWDDATAAAGQWTPEAEAANADKAAKNPDVLAYIGPYNSGAAKISMPILNKAGVLMISPANTWPGLTKPGNWGTGEPDIYRPTKKINYTRVVPTDDLQGPFAANWAKEMGVKQVYVLDDNELYGKGIAKLFAEHCKEIGIKVLGQDKIDVNAQEFKSLMVKIKSLNPDMIYFGGTTQSKGGQLARDMVGAGLQSSIMVPDGCFEDAFVESAGAKNIEGRAFFTFGGLPPEELKDGPGKAFVDRYMAKYKTQPEAYAIYGYECGKVALESIRKANKKDRAAVVAAALSLRDFDGALGKWSFDANGDISLAIISGSTVKNGKLSFVKQLK